MAHLTDMEELLARVPGSDIRDYMREALSCYMSGAYRGALVLTYIALFDDLLAKLSELGSVNATAKSIYLEANKRKADQDIYESYLIDQLTSKSLISGLDSSFLTTLRTLRNKSAHPSGHKPSAEEARFVFFEAIDRFMSKPILSTTQLVDELVLRLKNSNFFPSKMLSDITNVVSDELINLHDEALPQLVSKMAKAIISSDASIKKNSNFFLTGLAKLDKPLANSALQTKLITSKVDDDDYQDVIIQTISANGKLISGLSGTPIERLRAVLTKKISKISNADNESMLNHPSFAIKSIASAISEAEFLAKFQQELEALFEKRSHSEFSVELVKNHPNFLAIYYPILIAKAGSSDFATANALSISVELLDSSLAEVLSELQSLELIVAIIKAAEWGAWSAKSNVSSKFARIPTLRTKAIAFTISNEEDASAIVLAKLEETRPINEFVATYLTDEAE